MKLNLKNYKYLKTRKFIKSSKYFLVYNSTSIKNFIHIDQKLKKLNLRYYKVHNTFTKKILTGSIHRNYKPLINSLVIIIKPLNGSVDFPFKALKGLDELFNLIGIKVNNKFYPTFLLKDSFQLNYRNDNLLLTRSLKKLLSIPSKLTQKV